MLKPGIRAGASSAVSSLAQLVYIALAFVFGLAAKNFTVFKATWILVGLLVIGAVGMAMTNSVRAKKSPQMLQPAETP